MAIPFTRDDGGRAEWRRHVKGPDHYVLPAAGDCVTRAFAIVTGLPYGEMWDLFDSFDRDSCARHERATGRKARRSNPDSGANPMEAVKALGARYVRLPNAYPAGSKPIEVDWSDRARVTPSGVICYFPYLTPTLNRAWTMGLLPADGALILDLGLHVAAMVNGTIRDTWNPARTGRRRVRGFWYFPGLNTPTIPGVLDPTPKPC